MTRTIAIRLQTDDDKIIHPLTWQYLFKRWIDKGIGPQKMAFMREPDRGQMAIDRLEKELESHPIVIWGD